jgi:hypothetical protein
VDMLCGPKVDPVLENTISVRLENLDKQQWLEIRTNMPQVEVRASTIEHPDAGRGLFNACGQAMPAGSFIAVLSFGKRYVQMGSECVVVAGNSHQKYYCDKKTPRGD